MQIGDIRKGLRVRMANGYTGRFRGVPATMTGEITRDFYPDCDGGHWIAWAEVAFEPFPWFPEGDRRFVNLRTLAPLDEETA